MTKTKKPPARKRERGNGMGTIYELPDGRWRWQSPPLGPEGKRDTKICRTKTEAEAARARGMTLQADGALAPPSRRTVAEQLKEWYEDERPRWALNTAANYRRIIQLHLVPSLGGVKLQQLTADHVRRAYRAIRDSPRGRGRSNTLLRTAKTALNGALEMAVQSQVLIRNPAAGISLKASRDAERRITPHWDLEQTRTFLEQAPDTPWGRVFAFALMTGLRRGEVLGLRWRSVVLEGDRPRFHVVDNWTRADNRPLLTTLKGKGQRRWLPVSGPTLDLLRRLKAEGNGGEYVFPSAVGTPLNPDNADRALGQLCGYLDLPLISPHGLRHTYVSVQRKLGVPIEQISKQLGHASPAITLAIYSHIFDEDLHDLTLDLSRVKDRVKQDRGDD